MFEFSILSLIRLVDLLVNSLANLLVNTLAKYLARSEEYLLSYKWNYATSRIISLSLI